MKKYLYRMTGILTPGYPILNRDSAVEFIDNRILSQNYEVIACSISTEKHGDILIQINLVITDEFIGKPHYPDTYFSDTKNTKFNLSPSTHKFHITKHSVEIIIHQGIVI